MAITLRYASYFLAVTALVSATVAAAPPPDRGGGKGKGGDEPAGAFEPAYVHTRSGKPPTLILANRDFSAAGTISAVSDARSRGLDHAPDEGRTLTEEHRALWETQYTMAEDGAITVTNRTLLHDGENSAAKVHCIATAANGARAYSLNSATGGELRIKTASGANLTYYNVGVIDSCDYFDDGSKLAAIKNLPGADGFELVTIDVATGAQSLLLTVTDDRLDLDEVEVARDGQSYLISWTDRRGSTSVPLISEWRAGQTLLESTVIAYEARHGSYICDFNSNNLPDDGYVYRSIAGRHPTWVEQVGVETQELIGKGKGDVYHLKPAC